MIWNILLWIILGGVAGWLASRITNRSAQMGLGANVIIGILGAIVGGLLFNFFGLSGVTGFNLYSLLVAVVGAAVLLVVLGLIRRSA